MTSCDVELSKLAGQICSRAPWARVSAVVWNLLPGLELTFSSTQLRAPAEATRPGEHKLHLMAPLAAEYLPDGHIVHMAFSVYWPPTHWAQPLPFTPSQPVPSAQQPAALQLPLEGHLPAPAPPGSVQLSDQERQRFQPILLILERHV